MKNKLISYSYLTILLIYLLAFSVIYFLFPHLNFSHTLFNVLIADIIATAIVFSFSIIFKNSSIYDPYWSVVPPVIVLYLIHLFPEGNYARQLIILALVSFWSIRLTINWIRSWRDLKHQDWRYTYIAEKTGKLYWPVSFLGIHLMPTLFVFLACLPLWYTLSGKEPLNMFDAIAALFTLMAILTEWIADEQLIRFRKNNLVNSFMKSGLWSISRHPNYLGEICFWAGMFLFILASTGINKESAYWTCIGLFSMIILFKFISIPMMEKRNISRKSGYKEYINQVPALFPNIFSGKRKSDY